MIPGLLLGLAVLVLGMPRESRVRLAGVVGPPPRRGEGALPIGAGLGSAAGPVLPVAAGLAAAALVGPVPGVLSAVAVVVGRRALASRRAEAERARERDRVGEVCTTLAAELRAGRPLGDALAAAADVAHGPSRVLLVEAGAAAQLGGDVPAVLRRATESAVPEVLAGLAACWQVCARSGSGLAAAVERLAEGCRQREEQRRAVEAALAGPRATAGLLALLPLAGIGLAAGLGAHPLHVLLGTPAGLVCLGLGLGLDGLGMLWTRRLVARAAR